MITSPTNTKVKEIHKLKQKKYRTTQYLIEGEHLVEEATKAGVVDYYITTKETEDCNVVVVSPDIMEKLSFTKAPQSIMAVCHYHQENKLLSGTRYLLLDNLQDPGNVGTLVRTALAFGFDQVILSKGCVDIYNDKVLRSMQGANFHLSCIYDSLETIIPTLQDEGIVVVGSALENGTSISQLQSKDKMAIVLGNEGNGMSKEILALCDQIGYIDIQTIESLNVAVAGSIMMYHFQK